MIPPNQLYLNVVLSITGDGIHTSWPVIKCSCISHLIKALIEQHSTFWNEKPFRGGSVLRRQYPKMYYQTWKIMKHDSHKRWNKKKNAVNKKNGFASLELSSDLFSFLFWVLSSHLVSWVYYFLSAMPPFGTQTSKSTQLERFVTWQMVIQLFPPACTLRLNWGQVHFILN